MTKSKIKPQTENAQEIIHPNSPYFDILVAAQSFSNIAAVLAGFAFAAVILAVQTTLPSTLQEAGIFKDWATIAFLVSFLGCIFTAFSYALISGEDKLYIRSYAMNLIAGIGFSISLNLIMFGLAMLTRIFLSPKVYEFAQGLFPACMFLSILYLVLGALDPIFSLDSTSFTLKGLVQLLAPSFVPLVIAWIIFQFFGSFTIDNSLSFFNTTMYGAFALIILSAVGNLTIASFASLKFRFSLLVSGIIVGTYSLTLSGLLLML